MSLKSNKEVHTSLESPEPERAWRVSGESKVYTEQEMFERCRVILAQNSPNGFEVGVGTDSQLLKNVFQFVTVISLWNRGKGGFYFYKLEYHPRTNFPPKSQKLRMFEEVSKSITLAVLVEEHLSIKPVLHIDASASNQKAFTSAFSDQLTGYAVSSGYEALSKPYSWIASAIGDRHTKRKLRQPIKVSDIDGK
jgi:predicted RNase H-related nuclease YkuK (DUF458 family)